MNAIEALVEVEIEVDRLAANHVRVVEALDENPFSPGRKAAYHQSYRDLADIMRKWTAAKAKAYDRPEPEECPE